MSYSCKTSPLRILAVSNCPVLEYLGSGYVIANFIKGMRSIGHDLDLLQPDDYEICQWMRPRANSYRQTGGMLKAVRRALQSRHYDIVEFWGGEAWLAAKWLVSRTGSSRPLVVQHTNGPEPRYNRLLLDAGLVKQNALQSWHADNLLPTAFKCVDAIVTVSEYDKIWLAERGLPPSGKVVAIENPLSDCFLGRSQKPRESCVIGFCGTWLPKKGTEIIISDITRILREFSDWRFLVLGTSPDAGVPFCFPSDIRQKIEVRPMITEKEMLAEQYERIDIFILPSLIESFGVALAEAMACSCAVVTTRVGLGASLIDGEHALLLEKPESPSLYEAVKRLILNLELRRQLGNAAWQRVQCLRWEHAVHRLSNTYEEWLADHRCAV